jgi:hypothetical protein
VRPPDALGKTVQGFDEIIAEQAIEASALAAIMVAFSFDRGFN